jgi:hypothetical protein
MLLLALVKFTLSSVEGLLLGVRTPARRDHDAYGRRSYGRSSLRRRQRALLARVSVVSNKRQSGRGYATEGGHMYIGIGTLVIILLAVLIFYFVRRA